MKSETNTPDAGSGGDARAQFEAWAKRQDYLGSHLWLGKYVNETRYKSATTRMLWDCWQTALAARQPLTMEDAIEAGDGTLHGAVDYWQERALRAEAELAARQPVGVEPVAVVGGGFTLFWAGSGPIAPLVKRHGIKVGSKLYAAPPAPEMSPDFTDNARAAIAWVLWHHQGGGSAIGQPLRYALGMGDHEELSAQQISEAKRYAESVGARTDDFKRPAPAAVQTDFVEVATCDEESADGFQWLPGFTRSSFPTGAGVFIGQPPAPAAVPTETFQAGVSKWMGECFLPSLYSNMTERGDRLLEEVLELLQSHGYDQARVATLVDYVYGRPVGEPAQEVGGVMVTLAGYCWAAGLDMHAEGARELERITQPEVMAKIRRKQEAKNALHFDTPLPGHATHPQPAAADCARRSGSGEDPEGFYDQTKGPDGGTHEGPCRSCGGSGDQQAKPEVK